MPDGGSSTAEDLILAVHAFSQHEREHLTAYRAMNVLCITPYYEPAYTYGGPSRSIPSLCRALAQQGIEVTVFTTNANGRGILDVPVGQPIPRDGVQVIYFSRLTPSPWFFSPGLARACVGRVVEFSLVHTNGTFVFPSLVAAKSAAAKSIPVVQSLRGEMMPWALGYKATKKRLYMRFIGRRHIERASALLCTDESERQAIKTLGIQKPTYVVPNALDTCRFANLPARGAMRGALGIPEEAIVILSLGRLHSVKRPDLTIGAFIRIANRFRRTHLVFAGPDEMRMEAMLRARALEAGCTERVHFAGLLTSEQVLQALADADLFIMTSESENFGMAAAEAMAAGLPMVVSDRIGISVPIAKARAGEVVALDVESVAQGLARLLEHQEAWHPMGQAARKVAFDTFDLEVVARRVRDCYDQVLGNLAS